MSDEHTARVEARIAAREEKIGNEYQRANDERAAHEVAGEEALRGAGRGPDEVGAAYAMVAVAHFTAASYYVERMRMLRGDS